LSAACAVFGSLLSAACAVSVLVVSGSRRFGVCCQRLAPFRFVVVSSLRCFGPAYAFLVTL